jgi:apolipoprotein N-acyltransferase
LLAFALTALSCGLYALAFPPHSLRPAAWFALAPFFLALARVGRGAGLFLAWFWAVFASSFVADALPVAIETYFQQPRLASLAFAVFVWSVTGSLYYMGFAWVFRGLQRGGPLARPVLLGAAWAVFEWMRGRLLTGSGFFVGNPWALVAYSQVGWHELVQIASLTGVYGISFLIASVNAAWLELLPRVGSPLRARLVALATPAALVAVSLGFGEWSLRSADDAETPAIPVAIVQGNVEIGSVWRSDYYGRNLEVYLGLTARALAERPALVLWPESALSFFLEEEPLYQGAIARLLAAGDVELVVGGPRRVLNGDDVETYANSVFLMQPDGRITGRYDKRYLVPFAEFFPLRSLDFLRRRFERVRVFGPGAELPPLPTRAGPAGVLVCNEAMLPEAARERVREGAEILFVPSNDTWIDDPDWAALMFDLVSLRAVEQRRYLVRASSSGPSAIVDPFGRVLAKSEPMTQATLFGHVAPRAELSAYARLGDAFSALAALAVAGALLWARRRRPGSERGPRPAPASRAGAGPRA